MGVPRLAAHLKKKWPGIAAKRDKNASSSPPPPSSSSGGRTGHKRFGGKDHGASSSNNKPGQARVPQKISALYVDMNGIIHPCCHSEDDPRVAAAPREVKIQRVLAAVDDLVQRTQPDSLLYLAMDGVAPRAKMNQQRSRRYMAAVAKHGVVKDGGFGGGLFETGEEEEDDKKKENDINNNTASSASAAAASKKKEKDGDDNDNEDGGFAPPAPPAGYVAGGEATAEELAEVLDLGIYSAGDKNTNKTPEKNNKDGASSSGGMDSPFMSMSTPDAQSERENTQKLIDDDDEAIAPLPPPVVGPNTPKQQHQQQQQKHDENAMGGFDSNCISPGTSFMEAVTAALKEFVSEKLRLGEWSANLSVIVSGSDEPGEGEHKLIDFIRRFSTSPGYPRGAHVIHGLDADLILLCLTLHISNVFILRDNDRRMVALAAPTEEENKGGKSGGGAGAGAAAAAASAKPSKKQNNNNKNKKKQENSDDEEEEENSSSSSTDDDDDDNPMVRTPSRSPIAGPVIMTPERVAAIKKKSGGSNTSSSAAAADFLSASHFPAAPPPAVSPMLSSHPSNNKKSPTSQLPPAGGGKPQLSSQQEVLDIYLVAEYLVAEIATLAVSVHGAAIYESVANNGRHIVDDFVFLCSIMGNDFMPRLPSAFAGEAAIDNILEVYVRNVVGKGFVTVPPVGKESAHTANKGPKCPDVNLHALLLFLEGYAEMEAALFRRFAVSVAKYLPDDTRSATGLGFQPSTDSVWADKYKKSTTCTKETTPAACAKYLEGMRFVFEYYAKTSDRCSWRWFFPFHHAPFAHEFAAYVRSIVFPPLRLKPGESVPAAPPAPPVEKEAPSPFVQLLCILPPTSLCLLPPALRPLLVRPPAHLASSFPHEWQVDFTCAEGQEHLSTVMIPFADLEGIAAEVKKVVGSKISDAERHRGSNQRELSCIIVHENNKNIQRLLPPLSVAASLADKKENSNSSSSKSTTSGGGMKTVGVMQLDFEDVIVNNGIITTPFAIPNADDESESAADSSSSPAAASATSSSPATKKRKRGGRGRNRPAGAARHFPQGLLQVPHLPVLPSNWGRLSSNSRCVPATGTTLVDMLLFATLAVGVAVGLANVVVGSNNGDENGNSNSGFLVFFLRLLSLALPLLWFGTAICLPNVHSATGTTHRNQVRETYNDWLCRRCGCLTFASGLLCFRCGAPYAETECPRVMASRFPKMPPVLSVDHSVHMVDCVIFVDKKFHEAAGF